MLYAYWKNYENKKKYVRSESTIRKLLNMTEIMLNMQFYDH